MTQKPKTKAPKGNANPTAERDEFEMLTVVGPPAHGKTSLTDEIAADYAKKGGKVWVVDPNLAWAGVSYVKPVWPRGGIRGAEGKASLDDLIAAFENNGPGMLILDDADKYARHATEVLDDLMTSFRHWQKDVVIVARRPQGIPKDAIANSNALAIFATREVHARRYIAEQIGDSKILKLIPTVPHEYLYYRQDGSFAHEVRKTKARVVVTKSSKEHVT